MAVGACLLSRWRWGGYPVAFWIAATCFQVEEVGPVLEPGFACREKERLCCFSLDQFCQVEILLEVEGMDLVPGLVPLRSMDPQQTNEAGL